MNRLHIRNGLMLEPISETVVNRDVFIADGRIVAIGEADGFSADRVIDAEGLVISPGLIDLCARLREPGQEYKADIASECIAAARGGITTLCCPPDTDPVIDEPAVVELIHRQASIAGCANVIVLGALTTGLCGERLSEMAALKASGCVGVSNCRRPVNQTAVLRRAFSYAANFGLTVFIEPCDFSLSEGGCAHEGPVATRLGLKGIPVSAETVAICRALELVTETGVKAHFGRLSSARGIEIIRRAKEDGLDITADVSAHQLYLTEMDISSYNSLYHVIPPLRSQRDMEALRLAVKEGVIDAICSDHQPHEPDAKHGPYASTQPGMSTLETLLPLVLRLVDEQVVPLYTALSLLTEKPASILGIDTGVLQPGRPADLCLIDTGDEWQFDVKTMSSRGRNSPFDGWELKGKAHHTIVGGKVVHTSE
jgi:dihydroorotase